MKQIPNCKICKLKCHGCNSYNTCLMRQGLEGDSIEDCKFMASRYYLYDNYLNNYMMRLCRFQDECKNVVDAWL